MNSTFIIYVVLLIIFLTMIRDNTTTVVRKHLRKKRGKINMTELIEKYIGKECIIYTCISNSQITGTILSCKDGWIEIERNGETDIVNCEYIIRVREYPRNKKGKKKSVILD